MLTGGASEDFASAEKPLPRAGGIVMVVRPISVKGHGENRNRNRGVEVGV